jgi:hypothetical protein
MVGLPFYLLSPLTVKPTFMIRKILLAALLPALLVSCKKDKDIDIPTQGYYFTAKIDGVETNFNFANGAQRGITTASDWFFIWGHAEKKGDLFPSISLVLKWDSLTSRVYVSGTDSLSAGYAVTEMSPYYNELGFNVTIISISAREVRGTFSGKVKDSAGIIVDISEGKFFLKISN